MSKIGVLKQEFIGVTGLTDASLYDMAEWSGLLGSDLTEDEQELADMGVES